MANLNKIHIAHQSGKRKHSRLHVSARLSISRIAAAGLALAIALTACGTGEPAPKRGQPPAATKQAAEETSEEMPVVSGQSVSIPKFVMSGDQALEEAGKIISRMSLDEKVSLMVVGYMDIRDTLRYFPEDNTPTTGEVIPESQYSLMTVRSKVEETYAPFLGKGADKVMMSLTSYPKITAMITPAFMSYEVVTSLLRTELGYDGVVYTPPLNDPRLLKRYPGDTDEYLAVEAVKAGCDILYQPKDKNKSIQALRIAVNTGNMSEDRIDASVIRILKSRLMRGEEIETKEDINSK